MKRKIILVVSVVIILLGFSSIFFFIERQTNEKIQTSKLLSKDELEKKKKERLSFIMFTQEECKYCIALNPTVDTINEKISKKIERYDVFLNPNEKKEYSIKYTPTIVAYSRGQEISRIDDELDDLYKNISEKKVVIDFNKSEQLIKDWIEKLTEKEFQNE